MSRLVVTDVELRQASPERKAELHRAMVAAMRAPANGEVADLEASIAALETKIGRTVEEVKRGLDEGTLSESLEVCQLLMLVEHRNLLVFRRNKARAG